jgi:hypothetical protein
MRWGPAAQVVFFQTHDMQGGSQGPFPFPGCTLHRCFSSSLEKSRERHGGGEGIGHGISGHGDSTPREGSGSPARHQGPASRALGLTSGGCARLLAAARRLWPSCCARGERRTRRREGLLAALAARREPRPLPRLAGNGAASWGADEACKLGRRAWPRSAERAQQGSNAGWGLQGARKPR